MTNPIYALFNLWPNRQAAADDIGVPKTTVDKWAQFGRIPSRHQAAVVSAARARGIKHITADWMLKTHSESAE